MLIRQATWQSALTGVTSPGCAGACTPLPPEPSMNRPDKPIAIVAAEAPLRPRPSNYPSMLAERLAGREKRPLGDRFGLTNFGVNLTRLSPGAMSALRHAHDLQDELVYALEGEAVIITDQGETPFKAGMCAGFRAGTGDAHHIVNRGSSDFVFLEVGDRTTGDRVTYPDDDLKAELDGSTWRFTHKDGTPY